jgi:protein phosphatase
MIRIDHACGSDVGLTRELNEDNYLSEPDIGLWAVADGMGGHEAGEIASGIVVRELPKCVRQGEALSDAIDLVHSMIRMAVQDGEGAPGMGATVVALKLDSLNYEIAWVGDSRAYLWNGRVLRRLTKDHSYVQMLLDHDMILESEVATHPARNVISQGLGVGGVDTDAVKPGMAQGAIKPGETLLLCSDGLTGEVDDKKIADILAHSSDARACVDKLIRAALDAGGRDNVTAIVVTPLSA